MANGDHQPVVRQATIHDVKHANGAFDVERGGRRSAAGEDGKRRDTKEKQEAKGGSCDGQCVGPLPYLDVVGSHASMPERWQKASAANAMHQKSASILGSVRSA